MKYRKWNSQEKHPKFKTKLRHIVKVAGLLKRVLEKVRKFNMASESVQKPILKLSSVPHFLIIGAPRCGTTSLYNYLIQHPSVIPAKTQEVNFFNNYLGNFDKGIEWYRSCFKGYYEITKNKDNNNVITGEALPNYMFSPDAPERVLRYVPKIKLTVLLRNPIDRAFLHYNRRLKRKVLEGSFEEIIDNELKKIPRTKTHYFLRLGIYIDHLKRWYELFPKEQILILRSEDFFENPKEILNKVFAFLNLESYTTKSYEIHEKGDYPPMNPETRKMLIEYFRPHNQRLYKFLERDFGWDK